MTTELPHTARLNRALTYANMIATEYQHREVGVETLIVALLRLHDGTRDELDAIKGWAFRAEDIFESGRGPDVPTTEGP